MNVLAVRQDNAGDVLLAGPAIRAIAARADRVTLLCGPNGDGAARLLPGVDDVIVWRAPWIDPEPAPLDPGEVEDVVATLRAGAFDEAVVFTSFHQSPLPLALLLRMAGVPRASAISEDYPGSLLDVRHRVPDDIHEVQRALSLAEAAGFPGGDARLAVNRPGLPVPVTEPYVVVHPGASVPARAWRAAHHAALVDALVGEGRTVVVTGGPGETDLTAAVAGPEAIDLGGRTSFAELADVLAGAACAVVGNTGPAHLAAAVGTPVVSLYAPTLPAVRWRPWMVPHVLLHREVECAGCRARACPVPGHPCLDGVTVEEVLAAVRELAPSEEAVPA